MRRGWYSDKYFENIESHVDFAIQRRVQLFGAIPQPAQWHLAKKQIAVGDIEVEMQWFTRRMGKTTVVGVDKSLAMLKHCTGYFDGERFIDTKNESKCGQCMMAPSSNMRAIRRKFNPSSRYADVIVISHCLKHLPRNSHARVVCPPMCMRPWWLRAASLCYFSRTVRCHESKLQMAIRLTTRSKDSTRITHRN